MKHLLVLSAALALGACATQPRPVADVTRFFVSVPPQRTSVAVIAADPAAETSLQWQADRDAIGRQLAAIGFTPAPLASAELVASVRVTQQMQEGAPKPPPFSIGIGGGSFGRNVGVGGGVQLPVGRATATQVRQTQMFMQLLRRADRTVVWEGRGTAIDDGTGAPIVPALAEAVLRGFPGESGRTVRVNLPR
jgi:hypothetical protein